MYSKVRAYDTFKPALDNLTYFGFIDLCAALLGLDHELLAVGLSFLDSVGVDFEHVRVARKAEQRRRRRLQAS